MRFIQSVTNRREAVSADGQGRAFIHQQAALPALALEASNVGEVGDHRTVDPQETRRQVRFEPVKARGVQPLSPVGELELDIVVRADNSDDVTQRNPLHPA